MSLADDVVGNEPLLAPILDLQRFSKPTTAEVLQRVQAGLLPHQIAFCEDIEHGALQKCVHLVYLENVCNNDY